MSTESGKSGKSGKVRESQGSQGKKVGGQESQGKSGNKMKMVRESQGNLEIFFCQKSGKFLDTIEVGKAMRQNLH